MQQTIYRIARFLAKLGVLVIAICALIGAFAVSLTQYEPFRQWAIGKGLEAANGALAGELEVGDVEGNLITGLTIIDARLNVGDSAFAFVPRIDLSYTLPPIFESRRIVASVVLHNPRINLLRNEEGEWNFSNIAKPSADTVDKPRSPLEWIFDVRGLEIRDGTVTIVDATVPPEHNEAGIDFLHSKLLHLNLGLTAFVSETEQTVEIDNLSFAVEGRDFRLVELAGDISADEDGLNIRDLRLETGKSLTRIDARLDSFSLFDTAMANAFTTSSFEIDLEASRVSAEELRALVPALSFLDGVASLSIEANGTLKEVTLSEFDLGLTNSHLNGTGTLRNLNDPDDFAIEATFADSKLYYDDVPIHIPGLEIPDLSYLGPVDIHELTYSGTVSDALVVFDMGADIATMKGGGWINYGAKKPDWAFDVSVANFDPGPVMDDDQFAGDVTARIVGDGSGLDPAVANARIRMLMSPSTVGGRNVERMWFKGSYADGGLITADTLLVAWGNSSGNATPIKLDLGSLRNDLDRVRARRQANFSGRFTVDPSQLAVFDELPSLKGSGWYNTTGERPSYKAELEGDRIDVADVTLDSEHSTRLGFRISLEGEGIDPDNMHGALDIEVLDAKLPSGQELKPFSATLTLEELEMENRRLLFESDFLQAEIEGQWRFASLVPTLTTGIDRVVNYVSRKRSYSTTDALDDFAFVDEPEVDPIHITYNIRPKDLTVIEAFMEGTDLEMDASLQGEISGTSELLGISSVGEVNYFHYKTEEQDFQFGGAQVDIDIRNISSMSMEELLDAEIRFTSDSAIRYNDMKLDVPQMTVSMQDGMLHANGAATLNDSYTLALDGGLDVRADEGYLITADTLIFGMEKRLEWRNNGRIEVLLTDNALDVRSFQMFRKGAESIELSGRFVEFERFDDVELVIAGMPLDQARPFIQDDETLAMVETLNGSFRESTITLNGTLEDPQFTASLEVDALSYSDIDIGDLEIGLDYKQKNLTGAITIRRPLQDGGPTEPLANVEIETLPIDLAMADREERIVSGKPVRITATADSLPIAIAGPFTTGLFLQDGRANLNFSISGTYPNLAYSGDGKIMNGLITVESTNVPYYVDARFEFQDRILRVNGVSIRNLPGDYAAGRADATGTVVFDGFSPKEFNIQVDTRERGLLVLSDATQAVNRNAYGDLVIATNRGSSLGFTGTLEEPSLRGAIRVLNASITVPYQESSGSAQSVEFIEFRDWVERSESRLGPLMSDSALRANGIKPMQDQQQGDSATRDSDGSLPAFVEEARKRRGADSASAAAAEYSILDRLDIQLDVDLEGRVQINIPLGPLQQLALLVDNDGQPLQFKMKGDDMTLFGTVQLEEGSRFVYFKTFDAKGTVQFVEDIRNPIFNVTGVYEGRRIVNDKTEDYTVTVSLTGPFDQLKVRFTYAIAGSPASEDEDKQQLNALFLLVTGQRLTEGGNVASSLLGSGTSDISGAIVNQQLSQVIRNIEFLQTIEVEFGESTDFGQARVNLVGQLGDFLVRYNGKVSSFEDGTISVEIPLSDLFSGAIQREVVDQFESLGTTSSGSGIQGETVKLRLRFRHTW